MEVENYGPGSSAPFWKSCQFWKCLQVLLTLFHLPSRCCAEKNLHQLSLGIHCIKNKRTSKQSHWVKTSNKIHRTLNLVGACVSELTMLSKLYTHHIRQRHRLNNGNNQSFLLLPFLPQSKHPMYSFTTELTGWTSGAETTEKFLLQPRMLSQTSWSSVKFTNYSNTGPPL